MASGIYSQSVNMRRAMSDDKVIAEAETDRVCLQAAVMRAITCGSTGRVLDTSDAVLVSVQDLGGETGRNVTTVVCGDAFDESGGYANVKATADRYSGKPYVVDGRHFKRDGSLTAAEHARRTDALASVS